MQQALAAPRREQRRAGAGCSLGAAFVAAPRLPEWALMCALRGTEM